MVSSRQLSVAGLLLALTLSGCSGKAESRQAASPPATAPATTAAATQTPTPTPKATADPKQDKKILATALVTADDLGKPWVKPKTVNSNSTKKGELCPGKPRETKYLEAVALERADYTEGTKEGAAIATFSVWTLQPGKEAGLTESVRQAEKACKSYSEGTSGLFTTVTSGFGPKSMAGADEVVGRIERIYYDKKHTQLAFVRHIFYARSGRVVNGIGHAFLMPKSDPLGEDFSKAEAMLKKQLAKSTKAFS